MSEVTRLLDAALAGDRQAAHQLLPLVYDELRSLAAARMAAEAPGHTLNATALVHEAYPRLVGDQQFDGRGHFFAAAAEGTPTGLIRVWDVGRERVARTLTSPAPRVAFWGSDWLGWNPDGVKLAAGFNDGTVRVWYTVRLVLTGWSLVGPASRPMALPLPEIAVEKRPTLGRTGQL